MGNHPSKERSSPHYHPHHGPIPPPSDQSAQPSYPSAPNDPAGSDRPHGPRRHSGRHDISIFGLPSRAEIDPASPEARKETKAEREARKLEKERALREKERERSVREEGVDGGFMVTLGVYTGTEDFSKAIVRQLMIERRLAPFWKGLNDHNDSWTENQLLAIVRGLPVPSSDETLDTGSSKPLNRAESNTGYSTPNIVSQTITVPAHFNSINNDSPSLSPSHPAFSPPSPSVPLVQNQTPPTVVIHPGPSSPPDWMAGISQSPSSTFPLFRGRAKTLASLTSLSRNSSQADMTPQEMQLPKDPYVNGLPIEVFLYKNASECPICFLYYPPYLNKTRCCDQPICSECFVQIKRPDPHPPEHHDDDPNTEAENGAANEEYQLVSEPATCPYCKMPEFGITYEPPPFRRGLAYANQPSHLKSAMSSSSSISSMGVSGHSRRRNQSLSVDSPSVITTDKIRPDWSKKLADARAHALRRAAAATALHNAAYVIGNNGEGSSRFTIGRRRRTFFGTEGDVATQIPLGNVGALLAAADRQQQAGNRPGDGQNDLFPGRSSSRRTRIDTLEELMMMEAIRQSIAAEEERKRKEDKESAKQAKKDEKQRQKEAKEAKKTAKLIARTESLPGIANDSSPSPVGYGEASSTGKGKAVERGEGSLSPPSNLPPLDLPELVLDPSSGPGPILSSSAPAFAASPIHTIETLPAHRQELRQLSINNSSASSFSDLPNEGHRSPSLEFGPNGSRISMDTSGPAYHSDTPPTELINFRSLAEVIDHDHVEHQRVDGIEDGAPPSLDQSTASTLSANSEAQTIVASTTNNMNGQPIHKIPSTDVIPQAAPEPNTTIKGKGRAAVA